jgi:hypothetical protein
MVGSFAVQSMRQVNNQEIHFFLVAAFELLSIIFGIIYVFSLCLFFGSNKLLLYIISWTVKLLFGLVGMTWTSYYSKYMPCATFGDVNSLDWILVIMFNMYCTSNYGNAWCMIWPCYWINLKEISVEDGNYRYVMILFSLFLFCYLFLLFWL